MFRAILFDLDGVIVNSEPLHFKADIFVCEKYGVKISEKDILEFAGYSEEQALQTLIDRHGIRASAEALIKEKWQYLYPLMEKELKLFDDFLPFAEKVKEKYLLSLTTSTQRALVEWILDRFRLRRFFKVVITADEVSLCKPHPEPYLKTVSALGISPEEGVAIEDSPRGIASAKSAGLKAIAVTNSFPAEKLKGADIIVKTLAEIEI